MSEPYQVCELCRRSVAVVPDGRGFPPDIAKRKLKRLCSLSNCPSQPKYYAGFIISEPIQGQAVTSGADQGEEGS